MHFMSTTGKRIQAVRKAVFISIHFSQSVNLLCTDCKDSHPGKLKPVVKCPTQGHNDERGSLHCPVHWLILSGIKPVAFELQVMQGYLYVLFTWRTPVSSVPWETNP